MQALTRNPLADPGIFGINVGAALAVVGAVVMFGFTDPTQYVWFALVGAAITATVVYLLGSTGPGANAPTRLALAGVAIAAAIHAIMHGFTILNASVYDEIRFWNAGAFAGRDLAVVTTVAPFVLAGSLLTLVLSRWLNAIALGEDTARSLGVRIGPARALGALAVLLLCGAATAGAGPIAFVGLAVPHLVRPMTGPDHRWLLAYALVCAPGPAPARRRHRPGRGPPVGGARRDRHGAHRRTRIHRPCPPPEVGAPMTVRALRFGSLSMRWYRRPTVVAVVLALLAGLAGFAMLSWGSAVSVGDTFATLLGRGTLLSDLVVFKIRMPRVAAALIVGVCLGIGGTLFQSLTRNPLGSPEIVGFTYGASAGAVLVLLVIGEQAISVSTGAIGLGFLTALAMYLLAWRGGVHGVRLVLIGVAVSAMLKGLVSYLLIRADLYDAQAVHVWLVGSLGAVNWDQVQLVAFVAAVAVPAAALLARPLDMLGMGDDAARSLGLPAELVRLAVLVTAVALTGVAVAASVGPIAFVALTAPQLARLSLTRHPGVGVLSSGAMGAVLLVAADLVARALPRPGQLPVGVVTGGLGGAYLSWLLWRERRAGRW